jgi:hypothetical protein
MLVESSRAPDSMGYPSTALVVGGVTLPKAACCYIGLRFRAAGTANNALATYEDDWFVFQQRGHADWPAFCAKDPDVTTSGAYTAVTLSSKPSVSTLARVVGVQGLKSGGAVGATKFAAGGASDSYMFGFVETADGEAALATPPTVLDESLLSELYVSSTIGVAVVLGIVANAYNMNIPRLSR